MPSVRHASYFGAWSVVFASWRRGAALLAAALLIVSCAGSSPAPDPIYDEPALPPAEPEAPPVLLDELGDLHHPISTAVPQAQVYFDQGMVLTFGFNHEAASRSFAEALELDPICAMCAWGVALALGPNINAPMGPEAARQAYEAVQQARKLATYASERERAYIDALANRYAAEPPEDRSDLDQAYADAMRGLYQADPSDIDAAVLFAESLMDLYPWNYWDEKAQPRRYTMEILTVLEAAMAQNPQHVGANHYYIHAVEEYYPERAVPAADRLGAIAPDAGHLVHMPSHIYWRVGRYDDALEINRRAVASDEAFFAACRPGAFYRAAYYPHNIHFLWSTASVEGRQDLALSTARKLAAKTAGQIEQFDFLEEFVAIPMLTLARFGRWDAVLGEPAPGAQYVYLRGINHYTRGLAFTRIGDFDMATAELAAAIFASNEERANTLVVAGGTAPAAQLLEIGVAHLEGELAAAQGDYDAAIAALQRAVALQDELVYMEPPPWYFPTRQALGAVMLDAGRAVEAEQVYRKDLDQYPSNGWSLYGLAQSLRAQQRNAEADWVQQGYENAWARADVALTASRF